MKKEASGKKRRPRKKTALGADLYSAPVEAAAGAGLATKIHDAVSTLTGAGYGTEVQAMLSKIIRQPGATFITQYRPSETALSGDEHVIERSEQVEEPEKWSYSLRAWALCIKKGPEAAFTTLPYLLSLDCKFFLGQHWVREFIDSYHKQGDETAVFRLFFGTRGVGVGRNVPLKLKDFKQAIRIERRIDDLLSEPTGLKKREAFKMVGGEETLSPKTIESIYRNRKERYDLLDQLLHSTK